MLRRVRTLLKEFAQRQTRENEGLQYEIITVKAQLAEALHSS